MKYRKYIVILICSIIIYMILTYIYNNLINNQEYITCYIATSDISKGDIVDMQKFRTVKISGIGVNNSNFFSELNSDNKVFARDVSAGDLIKKEYVVDKNKYADEGIEYEYISIRLEGAEHSVSYTVKKGSNINIYYTSKTAKISDMLQSYESISNLENSGFGEAYTTIRFLSNIKIVDALNSGGRSTSEPDVNSVDNLVDTIVIKVTKDVAMKINNLKNYGTFSCTINE